MPILHEFCAEAEIDINGEGKTVRLSLQQCADGLFWWRTTGVFSRALAVGISPAAANDDLYNSKHYRNVVVYRNRKQILP